MRVTPAVRSRRCFNIILLTIALLVLATGIIGGVYLFKYMIHRVSSKVILRVNVLKFRTPKKKEHPKFIFSPDQFKQREVTNSAKGGNLIASHCKIGYFPHKIFGIFLFRNYGFIVQIFRTFTIVAGL